ncbi:MAG: riboflavin synthase [Myxococcales bacterium]|nr:riboflavin synthase [Myxococcales bacterium]
MFTGIVDHVGTVARVAPGQGGGRTLVVRHGFTSALELGESIAHDGVCLTVVRIDGDTFWVEAGPETLARTTIGALKTGSKINLERAATLSTRLGGHLVQGHVDAVGHIRAVRARENAWDLDVDAPPEVLKMVISQGSVTVDGISLTVTGRSAETFSLSIIPHTWKVTSLADKGVGSAVNVEVDVIARYVLGLLEAQQAEPKAGGITEAFLREHGF